jgi:hypothetical protein
MVIFEIRLREDCISSMRRNMNTHATNGSRNDALSKRITHFRKAFARGLGHRPTALQNAAMMRAATLAAQAELVLADPEASINDKVRIDGAARRALADMQAALQPEGAAFAPLRDRLRAEAAEEST